MQPLDAPPQRALASGALPPGVLPLGALPPGGFPPGGLPADAEHPHPRRGRSRRRPRSLGVRIADGNTWFAGIQTFAQGVVGCGAHMASALARWPAFSPLVRVLQPAADFLNGTPAAAAAGSKAAAAVGSQAGRGLSLAGGLSAAARIIGRLAPVFNVLASSWDTVRALAEGDPDGKRQAVANAAVSWTSTLMVLGSLVLGATPLGIGLAAGAAAIAGAQLVDNLFFDGRGTRALGDFFRILG